MPEVREMRESGDSDSYTLAVLETLKAHGFELVFTTRPERTRLPAKGFVFSRIAIREHDNLDAFCRKLQGAHDFFLG